MERSDLTVRLTFRPNRNVPIREARNGVPERSERYVMRAGYTPTPPHVAHTAPRTEAHHTYAQQPHKLDRGT